MKTGICVWLSASLIWSATIAADTTGKKRATAILIEPDQLQTKLEDENVRIVDVRSPGDYAKGHIRGAVRADVGEWKNLSTADRGLHDVKGWSRKVGQLGINKDTHVIVYGNRITNTARIWWLLKYVGVKNASILNGGWEGWAKKDRPTESSAAKIAATKFQPDFQSDRLEEIDSLKRSLKSKKVKVVDTRSDSEFAGGRIPGSAHLEWKELLARDGRFKTTKQLQELFRKRGIVPSETAVCY